MQDKKDKKNPKKPPPKIPLLNTFALAGGEKNPGSGTTIPTEYGVETAKEFIGENKK